MQHRALEIITPMRGCVTVQVTKENGKNVFFGDLGELGSKYRVFITDKDEVFEIDGSRNYRGTDRHHLPFGCDGVQKMYKRGAIKSCVTKNFKPVFSKITYYMANVNSAIYKYDNRDRFLDYVTHWHAGCIKCLAKYPSYLGGTHKLFNSDQLAVATDVHLMIHISRLLCDLNVQRQPDTDRVKSWVSYAHIIDHLLSDITSLVASYLDNNQIHI